MKIGDFTYIAQSEFWGFFLEQKDAVSLLEYDVPFNQRKALFNKYVTVINVETSSFCNRNCSYCPVSDLDYKSKEFINRDNFDSILNSLEELEYRGILTLNLFNEPLAFQKDFISRVESIRKVVPDAYIRTNSNGDYLTKELLVKLKSSGINEMLITMHTLKNESYDDVVQHQRLDDFITNLGLDSLKELKNKEAGKNITYEVFWEGIRLLIVSNNWDAFGNDRGGSLEHLSSESRDTPCTVPFREVVIDYNGMVVICWNVFRDASNSIGNISKLNIVDVYFDKRAVDLRREMLGFGPKKGIHKTCNVPSHTDSSTSQKREELLLRITKY